MCDLSEGVERRGIAKGKVEGRVEGRVEMGQEALEALMDTAHVTLEQAMDLLRVSADERPRYRQRIGEKQRQAP